MYLDENLLLHNILPLFGSGAFAAFLGYFFARTHKRFDARAASEDALLATGPAIIAEQNKRIDAQNKRIDGLEASYTTLWIQHTDLMDRERRCQLGLQVQENEIKTLKQRIALLERGADQA